MKIWSDFETLTETHFGLTMSQGTYGSQPMWPDIPGVVQARATGERKGLLIKENIAEISDLTEEAAAKLTLPITKKNGQLLRAGKKKQIGMNLFMEKESRTKEEKVPSPREKLSMTTKATEGCL